MSNRRSFVRSSVVMMVAGAAIGLCSMSASAQTPVLIDVNPYSTTAADASPASFARLGSSVIFSANDGISGVELWITDGTTGGTTLLRDINGSGSSTPQNLTVWGSRVVFTADDGVNGRELWITDGTTAGTVLLKDVRPGATGATFSTGFGVIGTFGAANSFVVFGANDGTAGTELWVSDGTTPGTVLLQDIRAGSGSSTPSGFFNAGGKAYFLANDGGAFGNELWSSDGTLAGTTRLTDIAPGTASSGYSLDAVSDGWGFGVANNLAVGNDQEPTALDLTTLTVRRLADIRPGTTSSFSQEFTVVGSDVYFRGSATGTDTQLYRVTFDGLGDPIGAVLVADLNPGGNDNVGNLTAFGGALYFAATDGTNGRELWRFDGLNPPALVANINPGAADSAPGNFLVVGSQLFFTAVTAAGGREVYVTDGTGPGTTLVGDLRQGAASSIVISSTSPNLIELGGNLLFNASGTSVGNELYTTSGGAPALVRDIRPQSVNAASQPQSLTAAGGLVYFTATDEAAGRELWATDGTLAGTVRVVDALPGATGGSPAALTAFGPTLLFVANGGTGAGQPGIEYYRATGTSAALIADINPGTGSGAPGGTPTIAVLGGSAFFSGNDGASGAELWRFDGTTASRVADFVAGVNGLSPSNITAAGSNVFFAGSAGLGQEPYRSDGTTVGLVEDFNPGASSSSPAAFFEFGGNVFMRATSPGAGSELAVFEPSVPDMVLVQDIRVGANSSTPSNFVSFNGQLFFTATDAGGNIQLYTATSTPGSVQIRSDSPLAIGSTATTLVKSGGYLYFAAGSGVGTNVELWAYDGVANGGKAFVVAEINPTGGSFPTDLTDVNGVLYFGAVGPAGGNELYRVTFDSLGVPNGAQLVADLNPTGSSTPRNLRFSNGRLFFAADNGVSGEELYVLSVCLVDLDNSGTVGSGDLTTYVSRWFADLANGTEFARFGTTPPAPVGSADLTNYVGAWFNALATGGC